MSGRGVTSDDDLHRRINLIAWGKAETELKLDVDAGGAGGDRISSRVQANEDGGKFLRG